MRNDILIFHYKRIGQTYKRIGQTYKRIGQTFEPTQLLCLAISAHEELKAMQEFSEKA